jgi:PhnB protein
MNRLITYLTFNGNCREAMSFYRECLGGELNFQTVGDSPDTDKLPGKMKNYILHATLQKEDLILMATDLVGEEEVTKGNSISILIECGSKKEMKTLYKKLSLNGRKTHPIKTTFWGTLLGGLTDKYNNNWLLIASDKTI